MKKIFVVLACIGLLAGWKACNDRKADASDTVLTDTLFADSLGAFYPQDPGGDKSTIVVNESDTIKLCKEMPFVPPFNELGQKAGGVKTAFWSGRTTVLKVKFIDGESEVIRKVMDIAKLWEPHSGVVFEQLTDGKANITVSFRKGGSWSKIGNQSAYQVPSMNLGWLTVATSEEEYKRVVLHEFGHALGLTHEHQNPKGSNIEWNVDFIKKKLTGPPNMWTAQEVERNIFKKFKADIFNGTEYDPTSIMIYAMPAGFRKDGVVTNWNTELSSADKSFIASQYKNHPFRQRNP